MKNVVVIIRNSLFNTVRNSEALRMSVGLTLEDNKITVLFTDDGVYLLGETNPNVISSGEIHKHIDTLRLLKHTLIAEKESLDSRNIEKLKYNVEILTRAEVSDTIAKADVVIPW
ncbi:MAG: DsrE family protein [Candidatus Brocadiales bacterium]